MAAAQEIGRLIVRLVGDGKQYQAMLVRGASQTKAFATQVGASMKRIGASMSSLGRSLALKVTLPLTIMGGLAIREFAKFDQAMIEKEIRYLLTSQTGDLSKTQLNASQPAMKYEDIDRDPDTGFPKNKFR